MLLENETLLMVCNLPTNLHRFPGEACQSLHQQFKPIENSTPLNNPPCPVPNIPNDPDSDPDPKISDSSS